MKGIVRFKMSQKTLLRTVENQQSTYLPRQYLDAEIMRKVLGVKRGKVEN